MTRPDFFIVGAPRCGTTAMYEYLRRHPGIFMPEHKEPQFFGDDLTHLHGRLSVDDYLGLFRNARPGQRVGEATTSYLSSASAAKEIQAFAPDARIIIMLRHPVDVMYSLHRELVFYGAEAITDFRKALDAEPERRRGRNIGPSRRAEALYYRHTVQFADHVARYLDVFGRDQVHIIVYDDFAADVRSTYAETLRFLDVDSSFVPDFTIVNESKRPRFAALQSFVVRPPDPIALLIPTLRRIPLAHRLRSTILLANSRSEERRPMDAALRSRLTQELEPEIEELGRLIGRDLGHWIGRPEHAESQVGSA